MGDYFDRWWLGATSYDLEQRDQLAALSASNARTTSRMRAALQKEREKTESLSTRLSKIENAVVAMVELEDMRGVLENFSDAVATRRYARDVLARIPALGRVASTSTPEAPPDVPGYWLHPAVRAVDAQMRGDRAEQTSFANEARLRDPARTAQFLAAVAILLGTDVADDDLATLWPNSRRVSQFQRALWLAVARGGLGDAARRSMVEALRWAVRQPDPQPTGGPAPDPLVQVRHAVAADPNYAYALEDAVLRALTIKSIPNSPATALSVLTTLRERLDVAVAEPAAESKERAGVADGVTDGVADVLAQVISAGAPGEKD